MHCKGDGGKSLKEEARQIHLSRSQRATIRRAVASRPAFGGSVQRSR
ncbi:hypothetical protein [Leptolyngbya ohadii]|nr:hypothetical protein [Leptolyngbya ohadii]